jgi:hypothetical protein
LEYEPGDITDKGILKERDGGKCRESQIEGETISDNMRYFKKVRGRD